MYCKSPEKLRSKEFSVGLSNLLAVRKAGSDGCKLPLKTTEEDEEATTRLAAAKETSLHAAVVPILSGIHGIFTLRENNNFCNGPLFSKHFQSLPDGYVN